jgi:hypothetical protein
VSSLSKNCRRLRSYELLSIEASARRYCLKDGSCDVMMGFNRDLPGHSTVQIQQFNRQSCDMVYQGKIELCIFGDRANLRYGSWLKNDDEDNFLYRN